MLRKLKSTSRLCSLFILTALSGIGSWAGKASDDVPVGFKPDRYQQLWERNPFTIVTPVAQVEQPKVFDKLVLVSWLNDGEKDVVFIQNSETNEVQKVTKEAEVVLSKGPEGGPVKFRSDAVVAPPAPQAAAPAPMAPGQQSAVPMAGM